MLAHGLLAPNPHNLQPWIADLSRENQIGLTCSQDRLLPETHPFGRQILIGCGAFIELTVMAAAELGFRVDVHTFPKGAPPMNALPRGVEFARLVLIKDDSIKRDPLFQYIQRRHSHKGTYDITRALSAEQ
jgi:hypothetical protein